MCRLTWGDVLMPQQDGDTAWIHVGEAKHDATGRVPLPDEALGTLYRLWGERRSGNDSEYVVRAARGGKVHAKTLSRRFRHYCDEARLPKAIHFHTLRHTYASWLAMAGEDPYRIQHLMRLKQASTVQQYAHLHPDHLAASTKRAFSKAMASVSRRDTNTSITHAGHMQKDAGFCEGAPTTGKEKTRESGRKRGF